jgi:hypothetical protein
MALVSSQLDKCKDGLHSFEYMSYIPDFEHQCYVLQFQCEYCELEISDIINQKPVVCEDTHEHCRTDQTLDTQSRYWNRPDQKCIESY